MFLTTTDPACARSRRQRHYTLRSAGLSTTKDSTKKASPGVGWLLAHLQWRVTSRLCSRLLLGELFLECHWSTDSILLPQRILAGLVNRYSPCVLFPEPWHCERATKWEAVRQPRERQQQIVSTRLSDNEVCLPRSWLVKDSC